ncbi:phosphoglycolate/pyridoxal phosphate phosphatase family [Halobacteroides halobius DSM 5150]|uniref:Acid sugar phosphatase n=1 Tax=Halobacteroides halobius (strain ATCC 35273 / DSM 5150 / MD-1) TaxID=748449 RepID=L0K9I6_HALHC|nr:phosphoglycolate/pyridoxal phosphate family phosphatase [Halobacteroides halobius]AGB41676.1 phosphoglycolate/pyridoxal phosphate phosphatase family [Halobacteroides halobius DSM 5150]
MNDLANIECFLLDMDGTFYLEDHLIPGALDFIETLEKQNKEYVFLTNNSSKSSRDYQTKLKRLGLCVPLDKIINSGEVTADYIYNQNSEAKVYVVGTNSLKAEFEEIGLEVITKGEVLDHNQSVDYVVLGFDTSLNYQKLKVAHTLILEGVEYIATNPDYVCPLAGGKTIPDCGSMIDLLKASTGKEPLVMGKPNDAMVNYILSTQDLKKDKIAMVGDRLYTDVKFAINADITSILVLTGETDLAQLEESQQNPDYVLDSIKKLGNRI